MSGDGLFSCAGLIAGGLIDVNQWGHAMFDTRLGWQTPTYRVSVTERGGGS